MLEAGIVKLVAFPIDSNYHLLG